MSTLRSVAKNTLFLTGSQVISKGLMVFYVAVLGRYVQATGLGQINTAQALCGVAFVLVNLGLDTLTVRDVARDRGQASRYFMNMAAIKLVLGCVVIGVLFVISTLGPYTSATRTIVLIYAVNSLVTALISIARALFQAYERMEYDGVLQVGRDVLNISLSLLAIALHASLFTIVWISVLATVVQLFGAVLALRALRVPLGSTLEAQFGGHLIVAALPFSAVVITGTIYSQLNAVLLPILQGERAMGFYSPAVYVYSTMTLVPTMFSRAIFPVFSRLSDSSSQRLRQAYEKSFRLLTIVGILMSTGIILLAGPVVGLLFGEGFEPAVLPLQILGLMFVFSGSYASGTVMNAAGKQNLYAVSNVAFIVIQLSMALGLVPRWGPAGASLALVATSALGFVYYATVCHRFLDLRPNWAVGLKVLTAAALMAGVSYGMLRVGVSSVVAALVVPVVYGGMLLWLRVVSESEWVALKSLLSHWMGKVVAVRTLVEHQGDLS